MLSQPVMKSGNHTCLAFRCFLGESGFMRLGDRQHIGKHGLTLTEALSSPKLRSPGSVGRVLNRSHMTCVIMESAEGSWCQQAGNANNRLGLERCSSYNPSTDSHISISCTSYNECTCTWETLLIPALAASAGRATHLI